MKPFNNYKAQKPSTREKLPAGGYIAKIMDAKEVAYDWGRVLLVSFDITDGQYKDFFRKDYQSNTMEDKKWRGTYRLNVPKDDGSEKDEWSKRTFGNAMWAIEESNPGFHWDWKEAELKGKAVGVLFRNKEWEMNGNTGWTTECGALTDVQSVKDNTFKPLKDKPLQNKAGNTQQFGGGFAEVNTVDEDSLPF